MILYYVPGGCSLATHIALVEAGLAHELVPVSRDKRTPDGHDFTRIAPKGQTPALQLDDGSILTESLALLAYVASERADLLPTDGISRFRALEAVSFMTCEVHGSFRALFYPESTTAEKERARQKLVLHFDTLNEQLGERPFLLGYTFTIADAYLVVMLRWSTLHGIEVPARLSAYGARMNDVPSVAKALAAEGL